jgi:SAM-dependent methyltransferase
MYIGELMDVKRTLKRVGFLVIAAGVWREVRPLWSKKKTEYHIRKDLERTLRSRQEIIRTYLVDHEITKLQIGAGTNPLEGWLNSDLEPISDDIIFIDAREEIPFENQVIDYIFSEHMIEHMNYKDGLFMLRECYRIMRPGGKIRIATPDVEKIIGLFNPQKTTMQKQYLEWNAKVSIGLYSPEKTELQKRRPEWDLDPIHINRFFPDASQDSACFVVNNFFRSYGHQFLYDTKTLTGAVNEAGFIEVKTCLPGESSDINLRGLESHHRLIGDEMNQFETMVLEGIKQ